MTTRRRAHLALAGMLAALAILAIAACNDYAPPAATQYTPADEATTIQQAPATVDTGTATDTVTNTVDPPAAHNSDLPTDIPSTTTRPKPATPAAAPATTEEPPVPLTTITESGEVIAPKPTTQDPPRPTSSPSCTPNSIGYGCS